MGFKSSPGVHPKSPFGSILDSTVRAIHYREARVYSILPQCPSLWLVSSCFWFSRCDLCGSSFRSSHQLPRFRVNPKPNANPNLLISRRRNTRPWCTWQLRWRRATSGYVARCRATASTQRARRRPKIKLPKTKLPKTKLPKTKLPKTKLPRTNPPTAKTKPPTTSQKRNRPETKLPRRARPSPKRPRIHSPKANL